MDDVYDLIILGAGCAGLSLANQLALQTQCPRTLILEQRNQFTNDRTWCFWQTANAQHVDVAKHAYLQFAITLDDATVVRNCSQQPYLYVSGEDFYHHALATIATQPHRIHLQLDAAVTQVSQSPQGLWQVHTHQACYWAKAIVDTRPPQRTQHARMWQCFYGIEVCTETALFHPTQVTLMAIDRQFKDGLGFMYVLPTSPHRALLEYTVFSPNRYTADQLKPLLAAQLPTCMTPEHCNTVRDEYGALPMGHAAWLTADTTSYVYAGLYAGGARASTGYSFQRIQRWATQCAAHLLAQGHPLPMPPDPRWLRWMDQLFLSVLLIAPARAPDLFFKFFSRPQVSAIARFMNDCPRLLDVLQIIAAMPKVLFLRALFQPKTRHAPTP